MKMYLKGTDPIDVHPSKIEEMKRKGWSEKMPEGKQPSNSKGKSDGSS
tara:strand:- start:63 stop:206 length:144 start_codon:yes stop_codon:yes gene_type:complete